MSGTVRTGSAPTLAEVAKLAGVSPKTASRVFNGEGYVSADTAERVQRAAELLGFRPNKLAQNFAAVPGPRSSV